MSSLPNYQWERELQEDGFGIMGEEESHQGFSQTHMAAMQLGYERLRLLPGGGYGRGGSNVHTILDNTCGCPLRFRFDGEKTGPFPIYLPFM